jgi:hypothetical protein
LKLQIFNIKHNRNLKKYDRSRNLLKGNFETISLSISHPLFSFFFFITLITDFSFYAHMNSQSSSPSHQSHSPTSTSSLSSLLTQFSSILPTLVTTLNNTAIDITNPNSNTNNIIALFCALWCQQLVAFNQQFQVLQQLLHQFTNIHSPSQLSLTTTTTTATTVPTNTNTFQTTPQTHLPTNSAADRTLPQSSQSQHRKGSK